MNEQDASLGYQSASPHAQIVRDSVREAMGATVPDRLDPEPADAPPVAARAPEREPDAAQTVAPDPAVIDAESDPSYRDRVEHTRQSRLSLWQAQR